MDYEGQALEDPRDPTKLADLIAALSANGAAFETRLLQMLGRADLAPRPVAEFPGFPSDLGRREPARPGIAPIAVAGDERADTGNLKFAVHAGGRHPEYLVATGEEWFFKTAAPVGPACDFHEWPRARAQGVTAPHPVTGRSEASYTESGDIIHCAHEELRAFRGARCKVDVLESHLCCRACIFFELCWSADAARLPCPG